MKKNLYRLYSLQRGLTSLFLFLAWHVSFAADIKISGKVTDSSGDLPGVTIKVKGLDIGALTDASGNYTITAPENGTLVFSFIGYTSKEVAINGQSVINVQMDGSVTELQQVVVVGYGSQKKAEVTGAIVNVKGEEISKQSSPNAISALQGKVAGVNITNTGKPGESPQIRIRGTGTVYGNPNPLYIVDGVWFDDINFLNPQDIENVSILKDASAQSIYGIRAANGVVLVTTKKGRPEKSQVSYNGFVGSQVVTNQVKMANANEFATLVNELAAANGNTSQLLDPSKFSEGTDWARQVLRSALIHNHQLTLSGGTEKSTYAFSLGYLDQNGIVENNNYKRYTARIQNDYQIFKNLKVGFSLIGSAARTNDIPGGIFTQIYGASPVVPVYYGDGSYGDPSDYNLGDGANYNPQVTLDYYNKDIKRNRINGSVYGEYKFAKNFTFRTSFGGDYGQNEQQEYNPVYAATLKQRNTLSKLSLERVENRNWIVENTLTYDKTINNDHNIKVLVGQGAQRYKYYKLTGSAQNVPNSTDGDLYIKLGDVTSANISDEGDLSTVASYFGRVNYDYKSKYLLTASLRADGSSKFFTGNNAWGYFPSVGLGWVISEESFLKDANIFDLLKLRASWGKIGNASVPNNISVLRVDQKAGFTAIFGGVANTGASINSVVPPATVWERGVGANIGLEAALLGNHLTVEADYYIKRTEQAIFDIPILSSVGTSSGSILGNQADFENKGFEFAATWRDNLNDGFSYSISGNIGINNNKVLSVITGNNPIYGGGGGSTGGALATRTMVGHPIGEFYGYEVTGIFQTADEVAASIQKTAKPGDFKYKDTNGDGVISGLDRVALGNPNPKYTYGINTSFNYKSFDLALDFQGVAGVDIFNGNIGKRYGNENFTKAFYDNRWHGAGTSNTYPSANIGGSQNYLPNSFFVESGSYFRIRNVQLGYTVPGDVMSKWKMQKLRVFANAQNPLTLFKYSGFSPEIPASSPINSGIDNSIYPLSATYNVGLNVTF
jgi:TonB-linked SusC/RagA family outer membrane protein